MLNSSKTLRLFHLYFMLLSNSIILERYSAFKFKFTEIQKKISVGTAQRV